VGDPAAGRFLDLDDATLDLERVVDVVRGADFFPRDWLLAWAWFVVGSIPVPQIIYRRMQEEDVIYSPSVYLRYIWRYHAV